MSRNFNGTTDYITINANPILSRLDVSQQFTCSVWIFPTADTNSPTVFTLQNGASYIELDSAAGVVIGNYQNAFSVGTIVATLNTWNHVAFTYNGNTDQSVRIYVNGVLDSGATVTPGNASNVLPSNGYPIYIGSWIGPPSFNFIGKIAELSLFCRALSAAEIKQIYQSTIGLNPAMPGFIDGSLIGYWHLNGQTVTEPDSSGNGLTGIVTGTTYGSDSPGYSFIAGQPKAPVLQGTTENGVIFKNPNNGQF